MNVRSHSILARFAALFLSVTLAACAGAGAPAKEDEPSTRAPTAAPSALAAAHEAYLQGDFVTVGERVRDVLLDSSTGELARQNAVALLDRSFDAQRGRLPSRFVFPAGIDGMELGMMRGRTPFESYDEIYLYVSVREDLFPRLTNIRVEREGRVLLDESTAIGKRKIRHDKPGFVAIVLDATKVASLPSDGVFAIRVDVDGKALVDTWVLGSRMVTAAMPEVTAPSWSESVADGNPVVRFAPFRSTVSADYEQRTLSVHVQNTTTKTSAWSLWTGTPGELAEVKVGATEGAPKATLAPGSYWLAVTAGENRSFGPVTLARGSQTGVSFNVVR